MDAERADEVLAEAWSRVAPVYDGQRARIFQPRSRKLIRRAGLGKGESVLDLGTGTGLAAFEAASKVGPTGRVLGVDNSEALLRVARRKAREAGMTNVEFQRMSMASLELSSESFDHVIGNYSLCCTPMYDEALAEAFRVLCRGGRLTYSYEGPHLPAVLSTFNEILMKHKVQEPREATKRYREANALTEELWQGFRDPFLGLAKLRATGFHRPEVSIIIDRVVHPSLEAFLEYKLTGTMEFEEMGLDGQNRFKEELTRRLNPFLSSEGIVVETESLYLTGSK